MTANPPLNFIRDNSEAHNAEQWPLEWYGRNMSVFLDELRCWGGGSVAPECYEGAKTAAEPK